MTSTVPFTYTHISTPPPAPGEYITCTTVRVITHDHGRREIVITHPILNRWDGEKWQYPASGWREHK